MSRRQRERPPLKYSLSSSTSRLVLYYGGIIYVVFRMTMANRMPILDCDEVFNYYEPLHYLVYGTGMQTWEYAPQYALRTYAYLLPMVGLSNLYTYLYEILSLSPHVRAYLFSFLIGNDHGLSSVVVVGSDGVFPMKVWTFCCLRTTLGGMTAICELIFLTSVERYSKSVAVATGMLLLTSTGMAHAAGAYLPSSTVLCLWLVCTAAYLRGNVVLFVGGAVVATLAVGWPFGVVVFIPTGLHILMRSWPDRTVKLLLATLLWTSVVQAVVMIVDYRYYDRQQWLSPVVNILRYNARDGGDELYGIEPASYYIKNLVLNFSYVAILGISALPLATTMRLWGRPWSVPLVVSCVAPVCLWLSIVVPRPHKEERFLYPIYPALCTCAALTMEQLWILTVGRPFVRGNARRRMSNLWIILLVPSCLMCISRTMALQRYYAAPLAVYRTFAQLVGETTTATDATALVCTCGEWHRFPSSFFLPHGYQLGFLPSSFRGQLPKPFGSEGVFNDGNKEEEDRYVTSIDECSYVVELEEMGRDDEPECLEYMQQSPASWTKVATYSFLDASKSSPLHRILYLPRLHEKAVANDAVRYNEYTLYQQQ